VTDPALLDVSGLKVAYRDNGAIVPIVDGVSLSLRRGEALGLAGESGCGKTTTALALLGLLPSGLRRTAGEMTLRSERGVMLLHRRTPTGWRDLRWQTVSIVFQGAMNALDPVMRIDRQISEAIRLHEPEVDSSARVGELLERVGIPRTRRKQYPHEFSGGMRQRAVIAMGLMAEPKLIVADEPTTALDVTVQQQILRLLRDVSVSGGSAAIFISHDVAVVSQLCSRVLVMYAGRVVEELDVGTLVAGPAHPYTAALVASVPTMDSDRARPLASIPGRAPGPFDDAPGCPFAPRCPRATSRCREEMPPLEQRSPTHRAACWHPLEGGVIEDVAV
jgi:oligopeptide/dipeptide ABC transporter ATP-binding protein